MARFSLVGCWGLEKILFCCGVNPIQLSPLIVLVCEWAKFLEETFYKSFSYEKIIALVELFEIQGQNDPLMGV